MNINTLKCEKCAHNDICAIKERYNSISDEIDNLCSESKNSDERFSVSVTCLHFSEIPSICNQIVYR